MVQEFFSPETLEVARRAVAKGVVRADGEHPAAIWWVDSVNRPTTYRVQCDYDAEKGTVTWVTCTCPHGLNAGGGFSRCYHAAAVLMTIRRARAGT